MSQKSKVDLIIALAAAITDPAGSTSSADIRSIITDLIDSLVDEKKFNANTIIKADANDTPVALEIAEEKITGRKTGGNITGLTADEVLEILLGDPTGLQDSILFSDGATWTLLSFAASEFLGKDATGNLTTLDLLKVLRTNQNNTMDQNKKLSFFDSDVYIVCPSDGIMTLAANLRYDFLNPASKWSGLNSDKQMQAIDDSAKVSITIGATSGWGFVMAGDKEEYAPFVFAASGDVVLLADASVNVSAVNDAANKLWIAGNGTVMEIGNNLGTAKNVAWELHFY